MSMLGSLGGNLGATALTSAYNTALQNNAQNYANILAGYASTMATQVAGEQAVASGYTNLGNRVLAGIKNVGQSAAQAIADQYTNLSGQASQDMINRGLGNTTVTSSVQRGLALDKSKADVALQNQVAQLQAGYQAQIGLAGLNYQGQAVNANTALANAQLGYMSHFGDVNAQLAGGYMGNLTSMSNAQLAAQTALMRGGGGGRSYNTIGGGRGGGYYGNSGRPDYSGGGRTNPYAGWGWGIPGGSLPDYGGYDPYGVGGSMDADFNYGGDSSYGGDYYSYGGDE